MKQQHATTKLKTKLNEVEKLYNDMEECLYGISKSVVSFSRKPMGGGAIKKVQSLAAGGIRQVEDDIDAAIAYAKYALKEIEKIEDEADINHQCYSDKDGNCRICGKEL